MKAMVASVRRRIYVDTLVMVEVCQSAHTITSLIEANTENWPLCGIWAVTMITMLMPMLESCDLRKIPQGCVKTD